MSSIDFAVAAAGLALIAWVNWYFFLSHGKAAAAQDKGGGVQEVRVTVRGGYDPAVIHVKAGRPVRFLFDRQETSGCSEEVVFPDFGVRKFLPAHKETVVDISAPAPGTYEFTCGMSMLRGRVVAQ
jgi:plastocyanin domain-containing protein